MKKVDIEWNSQLSACVMVGFDELNIHLIPGILPADFVTSLMPRAGMFIDFHSRVTLRILDYNCKQEQLIVLNGSQP